MGFCNRCGDIIKGTKCQKCGGRSVDPLAKGVVDSYNSSTMDRWQSQYAPSIITESIHAADICQKGSISPLATQPNSANHHHQLSSKNKVCHKYSQPIHGPRVSLPTHTHETWHYHYDCLACAACNGVFTESEFVFNRKYILHLHCSTSITPSPPTYLHNVTHRRRFTVLPKLGGSKICPGCHASISVMEESPGPRASRWHKKCLKCTGCKKQMDSNAKVMEKNDRWFVRCSGCLDRRNLVI